MGDNDGWYSDGWYGDGLYSQFMKVCLPELSCSRVMVDVALARHAVKLDNRSGLTFFVHSAEAD